MRRLTTLFPALLAATMLTASPISRDEARRQAQAFLNGRTAAARAAEPSPALADVPAPSPACYAFNIGSGEGFVIVAADDRPEPVIAYAESGAFSAANLPTNARAWLDALTHNAYPAHNAHSPHPAHSPHLSFPVRPLITTQWGQQSPYNWLCPDGCVTGCVATATAQVMNYHRWPQAATTAIPAYSTYDELPPTTFDWAAMPAMLTDGENYEAVARLMQYCGHAEQMRYSAVSWAYEEAVPLALTRFFGYDAGARVVYRNDYTNDAWTTLILGELQAGRPVIYGGNKAEGGHEFVVDGYDGEGFFHINWGWGGQSDGWYRLEAANPESVGTGGGGGIGLNGYSTYQSAVIGVQPDQGGTAPDTERRLTAEEMILTSAAATERTDVSKPFVVTVCCPFANHTADTLVSNFGLALLDADGQLVEGSENMKYTCTFTPGSHIYRDSEQKVTFGAGVTGTYRIVPVCSVEEGKNEVLKIADGADRRYIEAMLTETTATLTEHPRRGLQIDDIQFTLRGKTIVATATVSNHGDDYDGLLYLFISGLREAYTGITVDAGATATATFCYERRWQQQEYQISYTKDYSQWIAKGKANYTTINTGKSFNMWYADGRQTRIDIENDTAVIPTGAAAVEFGDWMPEVIIPNSNPNCIYYVPSTNTATEQLKNVVTFHYTPLLTLTDGHDFYCPMPFTAEKAIYTRTFSRGYDGEGGGWDTIILPFDVTTVTAGSRTADWFHSPDDTGKDFWLMTIATANEETLTFTHAERLEANRPYLIAVPGSIYGERSLQGSTLTFSAGSTVVRETAVTADTSGEYSFAGGNSTLSPESPTAAIGSTADGITPTSYQLNANGSNFKGTLRRTPPFRAALLRYCR